MYQSELVLRPCFFLLSIFISVLLLSDFIQQKVWTASLHLENTSVLIVLLRAGLVIEFSLHCFLDTFSFVLFFYLFRKPFSFGYTVFDFLSNKNMKNSKTFVHWKHTSNLYQLPSAVTAAARMFWSVCGICPALRLMLWHSNRAACH